jgi:DUF1365 family protein
MKSRVYEGTVRHRRFTPVEHAFQYRICMMYLDLAELPTLFVGRWLWSTRRAAPAAFRRSDYHGDPAIPLDEAVRNTVEQRTGSRPRGPIRLLTHLRYYGYIFNPVSFYYVFNESDTAVETVVAEITNTPWMERHAYVLPRAESVEEGSRMRFRFSKDFHVSPFNGMDHDYDWRFSEPGKSLSVHMENSRQGSRVFDATMVLREHEVNGRSLSRVLLRYPAMTAQVVAGIYLQALKLWWKGAPFHTHPMKKIASNRGVRTT